MMKLDIKSLLLLVSLITIWFVFGCKNNITGDDYIPGTRNYEWFTDTLSSPRDSFHIDRIWGSSSNDVWGTGGYSSSLTSQLWHYDGDKWSKLAPSFPITAIYGFAKNNIWYFSNNSYYHYDGSVWTKYSEHKLTGYDRIFIYNIWGIASNDIYAVGYADHNGDLDIQAVLMHFDGYRWDFVNIPKLQVQFFEIALQNNTGEYIIGGAINSIYEFTGRHIYTIIV